MNVRRKIVIILSVGSLLLLPDLATSADKSVLVGFHQKPGPSEQAFIHGARGIIKRTFRLIPAMAVTLPEEEIVSVKKNSNVAYVEEEAVFTAVQPLPGEEYVNAWGVWRIFADIAHASGNKGAGVRVAVIDTGIDYTHPELAGNYQGGYDFVFDDNDPFDDSRSSHGTHVAGIIAAEGNGTGVIGVAPEADLYAVKVLDGGGFGLESWIIAGIEWAVDNNMDIINLSLEGPGSSSLQLACDAAYDAGVMLVAAGGNLGANVAYPAAYASVIAVTATDSLDDRAAFSPSGPEVELAAPGVDILSTARGGGYDVLSGTSQAAPHVAGTAALLIGSVGDVNDDGIINNVDVRQALQISAMDLDVDGRDDVFGFGLVNAASASLDWEVSFTLTKTSAFPLLDSETVHLDGAPYEIHIVNSDLVRVAVDVFEGGSLLRELSAAYNFNMSTPQEVVFLLDATGKRYDMRVTPYGKPGSSLTIMISLQGGEE